MKMTCNQINDYINNKIINGDLEKMTSVKFFNNYLLKNGACSSCGFEFDKDGKLKFDEEVDLIMLMHYSLISAKFPNGFIELIGEGKELNIQIIYETLMEYIKSKRTDDNHQDIDPYFTVGNEHRPCRPMFLYTHPTKSNMILVEDHDGCSGGMNTVYLPLDKDGKVNIQYDGEIDFIHIEYQYDGVKLNESIVEFDPTK